MVEILPIKLLSEEDSLVFGSLNVALGKLQRSAVPVAPGVVVTPPAIKLKTVLEHFDFGTKEIFEQSLTLVRKEINSIPPPEILTKELRGHKNFLLKEKTYQSSSKLWLSLLEVWFEQIKSRLWREGFSHGLTEELEPQQVIFTKKIKALGLAFFDLIQDDIVISIKSGKLTPAELKELDQIIRMANRKLLIPHEYEWILDHGIKLTGIHPLKIIELPRVSAREFNIPDMSTHPMPGMGSRMGSQQRSAVKVFMDLSAGQIVGQEVDGIYMASEKIFDLNKPRESFEEMISALIEVAADHKNSILFKLADISEGMGKIRGTLRLLHQDSLLRPMIDSLDFIRHKKGFLNIHIVIPFVRGRSELMQIKRELAVKKLARKNSLKHWLEVAVPENIINLADYLTCGLDGVVLNLDELIAYLNGFDHLEEELTFYKTEVSSLLKFLEEGLKLMHKLKVPFIAVGNLALNPEVLDFLVEKGVYGVVVQKYEIPGINTLLHQAEKKMILRRVA